MNKLDIAADFNQLKSRSVQKHVKFLEADLQFSPFVLVGDISAIVKLVNLFLQEWTAVGTINWTLEIVALSQEWALEPLNFTNLHQSHTPVSWRKLQWTLNQKFFRLSSWDDQAGVIQAISPISMKRGQNGYIKKPHRQSGLALGFFSRYLAHPPGFGVKNLKIEPKLALKSEKPPDHRMETILPSFSLKKDYFFSSLPQQFQMIQIDRGQSRAVNSHACYERSCGFEI